MSALRVMEWLVAASTLSYGSYELWALLTGHETLSRFVWTVDMSPYGALLPLAVGVLVAHFFIFDWKSATALLFGLVGGAIWWHKVG